METTTTPTGAELAERAAKLAPTLRANAMWQERNARLADETVQALVDAGIFRMRLPKRYGGYETPAGELFDVGYEIGRADGAAAFNVAAWWITSWNMGLFPEEAQDEVFADPDVRICGTHAVAGTATPVPGGIVVNGEWPFNSGAAHSQWKLLSTVLLAPGAEPEPVMAVVPMSELRIVDDWDTTALRGTGSVTTVAENLFVPSVRTMPISALASGEILSDRNRELPLYRTPLVGVVAASTGGKMCGMARAASDAFFERIEQRTITTTFYEKQADAAITHLQAAEATLKLQEAEFQARHIGALADRKAAAGEEWTMLERAYARAVGGRVPQLTAEAVDLFAGAAGASSLYTDQLLQRIRRDVTAVTVHSLHLPTTTMELYGRLLCGKEPNTFFI